MCVFGVLVCWCVCRVWCVWVCVCVCLVCVSLAALLFASLLSVRFGTYCLCRTCSRHLRTHPLRSLDRGTELVRPHSNQFVSHSVPFWVAAPVRISLSGCIFSRVRQSELSSALNQPASAFRQQLWNKTTGLVLSESVRPSLRLEQRSPTPPHPPRPHPTHRTHFDVLPLRHKKYRKWRIESCVIACGTPTVFPRRSRLCHLVVIRGPTAFDKHVTNDRNVMWTCVVSRPIW